MPGQFGMYGAAAGLRHADDLHEECFSRLDATAHVLAVYASRRGSPHAAQDSLLAAGQLCQAGLSPAGSRERFPSVIGQVMVILLSQAFLTARRIAPRSAPPLLPHVGTVRSPATPDLPLFDRRLLASAATQDPPVADRRRARSAHKRRLSPTSQRPGDPRRGRHPSTRKPEDPPTDGTRVGDEGVLDGPWCYVCSGRARKAWKRLFSWMRRSRLGAVERVANTIDAHLSGIVNAVLHGVTTAGIESVKGRTRPLKDMVRGFHDRPRIRNVILFHPGGLDLDPASVSSTDTDSGSALSIGVPRLTVHGVSGTATSRIL